MTLQYLWKTWYTREHAREHKAAYDIGRHMTHMLRVCLAHMFAQAGEMARKKARSHSIRRDAWLCVCTSAFPLNAYLESEPLCNECNSHLRAKLTRNLRVAKS